MKVNFLNRKTTNDFQPRQIATKLNSTNYKQPFELPSQPYKVNLGSIERTLMLNGTISNNGNMQNQVQTQNKLIKGTLSRETLFGSKTSCYESNQNNEVKSNNPHHGATVRQNHSNSNKLQQNQTKRRFLSPDEEQNVELGVNINGLGLSKKNVIHSSKRNISMQRKQTLNSSSNSISNQDQQAQPQIRQGFIRKEDQILQRLINQEKYLDSQLKQLEQKYSEMEINPGTYNSNGRILADSNLFLDKASLLQRAEKAHQELRNYFAKLDKNQFTATQSSSDSTAEDNNIGGLSSLPPIDSLPGTASNGKTMLHSSGTMSRADTATNESNKDNQMHNQIQNSQARRRPVQSQTRVQMSFKDQAQQIIPDTMDMQLRKQITSSDDLNINKLEDYQLIRLLGSGAYATVKLGQNKKSKQKVAIKIYPKYKLNDPTKKKAVQREIICMKKLDHPNIVKLFENFETSKEVYLIQEYINGVSLYQYIKNKTSKRILAEDQARFFFKQLCESVRYLHSQNICHRDLKLENILVDDRNNVKLIDFGFSICTPPDQKLKIFCGTPSYMAPEIVLKKDYCGFSTDVWSLGIILFVILSGNYPFKGQNERDLFSKISRGLFHMPETVPFEAKRLITKMLNVDPLKRPSTKEVRSYSLFTLLQLCADRWLSFPRAMVGMTGSFISPAQFFSNSEIILQ
ncbi:protein kinase domain containing protein [Stylonychia lemnae]|uniref:Protein kinase domain containing protein n=1 Tax=Stylonychia lemnae TaxID=5949 RepID=A0A078AAS3_STYLE|nr:protein kinase domain containing protein [Stylonychia lemnae]|eukprot:CDW78707.1 protein kinase domain containing protein [Stylonychia lemnae]